MPKTKIVCTVGPASQSPEVLRRMILQGMDVARLNFAHGSQDSHGRTYLLLRKLSQRLGKPLAVLQDLPGPKMRIGTVSHGQIHIKKGATFVLTTRQTRGSDQRVNTTYCHLPQDVKPGDPILLGDGYLRMRVTEVITKVMEGGMLKDHMGLNLPGTDLSAPPPYPQG